ncbi:MAG: hypothetical protein KDB61_04735, partial [Planctomycetes bacterium]|nr:hypothetical protein [Planctomycetota bacterium]
REFTLEAGSTFTQQVDLLSAPVAGGLSGVVRSQSGNYKGQLLVFLYDDQGTLVGVFPTTWKPDGERGLRAAFAFDLVPPGTLSIDVVSLQDEVLCRVEPAHLVAPRDDVEILLLDREPACDWVLTAVNDVDGEPLEAFEVRVEFEDGRVRAYRGKREADGEPITWTRLAGNMRWNQFQGPAMLYGLDPDARFRFTVQAEGFADATGNQDDFHGEGALGRSISVRMGLESDPYEKIK